MPIALGYAVKWDYNILKKRLIEAQKAREDAFSKRKIAVENWEKAMRDPNADMNPYGEALELTQSNYEEAAFVENEVKDDMKSAGWEMASLWPY